ncbi:hypothetical protein HK102_002296 [Quaeritorhiza haematococci]|nr:hypothetical protein HK102_002296 [Quaeritorhiza haematococci]
MVAVLSAKVETATRWQPFLISTAVWFLTYSIVFRVRDSFEALADGKPVLDQRSGGYSSSDVLDTLEAYGPSGRFYYTILLYLSYIHIAAYNVTLAFILSAGLRTIAPVPALRLINLIPFASVVLHFVEYTTLLYVTSLVSGAAGSNAVEGVVGYASLSNQVKGLIDLGIAGAVSLVTPIFLYRWITGIGRDQRQVVKEKKAN